MIRINLLPVREARRKAGLQQQMMLLGGALVASLALSTLVHITMKARTMSARSRVAALQAQIDSFKGQLGEVEEFRKKKADTEQKLSVIDRLDKSRSGPVHVLDELATRSPERLWITKLEAAKGGIKLEGMALDNEGIAELLTSLNASDFFEGVELVSTELEESEGLKLNSFVIVARITVPGIDPLAEADAAKTAAAKPSKPAAAKH